DAYDCHGLRRCRPRPHTRRKHANTSSNALDRPDLLRLFPGPRSSRERACRNYFERRSSFLLGTPHKTLARRIPFVSSSGNRRFLSHCTSVVHPLRSPQSRFLSHLHHRTQFQTLPHTRIPALPAVLVLRSRDFACSAAMDRERYAPRSKREIPAET